jgi:DNA-binding GntR family transcriptional regulator
MNSDGKTKLKKGDLNDSVYTALKELILSGRLKPGVRLVHQDLANQLSVSRTPVRESLERLYQEGFAGRRLRRGYFVAEIRSSDVRDLYGTREALEMFGYEAAFEKGFSKPDIAELEAINNKYASMFPDSVTRARLKVDRDFHLKLAGFCGNQVLLKTLDSIFEKIELKRRLDGYGLIMDNSPFQDHQNLVTAIKAKDFEKGREVLRNHIREACGRFLRHLQADVDFGEELDAEDRRAVV